MLRENIDEVEKRIQAACNRSGRERSEVTLIAVSKTKPIEMLEEAYGLGMRFFGENKVQELKDKYDAIHNKYNGDIHWHLIGHLQRNKVKYIIDKAELIHSVDSLRLAEQIDEEAAKRNLISDILIEVNIAREDTKFGVMEEDVLPLLLEINKLEHIRVRGFMTIAPMVEDPEKNRRYFRKLRELYVDIKTKNIDNKINGIDILSMGMTGDFEVAIEEGATMVRVGTGIFGSR